MKDAAGIIREWEGKGGILITSGEQKKVFQWFDTLSPDERVYWYKRVLALPFSRPQIRIIEYDPSPHRSGVMWSISRGSPETKAHFFGLTNYLTGLTYNLRDRKSDASLYELCEKSRILMNPLTPTAWEQVGQATIAPPYVVEGEGAAYVFAMSFLDALSPCLEKNPEVVQWLLETKQSLRKTDLPHALQAFCKKKEGYAYHVYQTLLMQCVPVTQKGLASVETFFVAS